MDSIKLYQDIATRTNGDIYIGVVGPVRSGKSTFLKKFMDKLILPNIEDSNLKSRIVDEMPQSANGKSVMTTEPKFVPESAVNVKLADEVNVNVRLIDCVGYMIDGVENSDRLVHTPWSSEEMSFTEASEIGTKKVISEHSTIGIVVTTDGSVTDFDRASYVESEEKIINEMKSAGKPFILIVNTSKPNDEKVVTLVKELEVKYNVTVIAKNIAKMEVEDIESILNCILGEFPLTMINVNMPRWMQMLPNSNDIIVRVNKELLENLDSVSKMKDYYKVKDLFSDDEDIKGVSSYIVNYSDGSVELDIEPMENTFYKVLSNECGISVEDESELYRYIKKSALAINVYDKYNDAIDDAKNNGYGIVVPKDDDIEFSMPEVVESNGKKNIKMSAKCKAFHIMEIEIDTEVNPIMASGAQGQEMVKYLENEHREDMMGIWHTNMFGKELIDIAKDGLNHKIYNMPDEAREKLRKTVSRIVNESKGGVLCILL